MHSTLPFLCSVAYIIAGTGCRLAGATVIAIRRPNPSICNEFVVRRSGDGQSAARISSHPDLPRDCPWPGGGDRARLVDRCATKSGYRETIALRVRFRAVPGRACPLRRSLLSRRHTLHYFRSRGRLPLSLGGLARPAGALRFLVDDRFSRRTYDRLHLRM